MYHFVADQAPEPLILSSMSGKTQVAGQICQYLKSFQIDEIRFLYTHLAKRELCILNDESGLGKSAAVSVCLAATLASAASSLTAGSRKKCLIVVQNDDDLVAGWQFHFDVLTTVPVTVISGVKDSTKSAHLVYIAKWGTLRSINDLSKLNFDIVVLDNRGEMLNNNFCTSMLLRNYEKKVNVVIASVDVTSDVKLMHNILRLGGRLEQQFDNFKVFENKFKLPDPKEIFNHKNAVDLEEYFQKREVLNYYCKKFRLRRYRHQYEPLLPLVDSDRFQLNLEMWRTATLHSNSNSDRTVETIISSENGTEVLFEQFHSIKRRQALSKPLELTPLSTPSTPSTPSIVMSGESHCELASSNHEAIDMFDTPMVMSPLLFVSDSESEPKDAEKSERKGLSASREADSKHNSGEIVDLTSEGMQVVPVESENTTTTKLPIHNAATAKKATKKKASTVVPEKRNLRSRRRKSVENTLHKRKQKIPQSLTEIRSNKEKIRKLNTSTKHDIQKVEQRGARLGTSAKDSTVQRDKASSSLASRKSSPLLKENQLKSNHNNLQTPKRTLRTTTAPVDNNSSEKFPCTTKKTSSKHEDTKALKESPSSTKKKDAAIPAKSPKTQTAPPPAKKEKLQATAIHNYGVRTVAITPKGIHNKMTRGMQRMTRSTGASLKNKYMLTALALDIDKKPGSVVIKRRKTTREKETKENNEVTNATTTTTKIANKTAGLKLLKPKVKKIPPPTLVGKDKPTQTTKAARKFSQNSILSTSDYEEIQCGQRLTLPSSSEKSAVRMHEQPPPTSSDNDFLIPPTPTPLYAMRNSQYALPSLFIESEVTFVPTPAAANKRTQDVIVVTSSQDSLSSSQQSQSRRTRALKQNKSSTRMIVDSVTQRPTATTHRLPTFGELLAKQQTTTAAATNCQRSSSPDLFSNCSDLGGIDCNQAKNINNNIDDSNNRTPFDGFKIFGSEVKQFQQQHAATSGAAPSTTSLRDRSCLDILEKMFEPHSRQQKKAMTTTITAITPQQQKSPSTNRRRAKTPILPAHPIAAIATTQKEEAAASSLVAKQRTQKKLQQQQQTLFEEDIFEISNNGTFGSVMRLNSNGEISPVQQQKASSSQHNKITNYYIGSGPTQLPPASASAETTTPEAANGYAGTAPAAATAATTPSKNRTKERLLSGTAMRRSPKSAKSAATTTQATKLTRWFPMNPNAPSNPIEEVVPNVANIKIEENSEIETGQQRKQMPPRSAAKRRRLELSFKN